MLTNVMIRIGNHGNLTLRLNILIFGYKKPISGKQKTIAVRDDSLSLNKSIDNNREIKIE
jgi:hypothetical protein